MCSYLAKSIIPIFEFPLFIFKKFISNEQKKNFYLDIEHFKLTEVHLN